MNRSLILVLACLVALPALPRHAHAQVGPSPGGGAQFPNYSGVQGSGLPAKHHDEDDDAAPKEEKAKPPPAAIPGAQPDPDAVVVPADKVAAEMSPNDALFDAITRGDLAAAKDAVSRGAQLDAKNVLGQTPTDAAIDLNRNDITFLLLSMRGAVSNGRPVRAVAQEKPHAKVVKATRAAAYADRGTPNPAVGFTGF